MTTTTLPHLRIVDADLEVIPELDMEPETRSPPAPADHCCDVEEVIGWLMRIRQKHGKRTKCMISFDGGAVPYMSINQIAVDDDDLAIPIALVCVSEGNHPCGSVIRMPHWSDEDE